MAVQKGQADDDDCGVALYDLAKTHRSSIVPQLLQIQETKTQQEKYLDFVRNLQTFSLDDNRQSTGAERKDGKDAVYFKRETLDAFDADQRDYIALSYTWSPSGHEDPISGRYHVERADKPGLFEQSAVRNCVLDRISRYMGATGIKHLWVDRHSIVQETSCSQPADGQCQHPDCNQKQHAVQAMDHVYSLSNWPTAVLGRPLSTKQEIELLHKILHAKHLHKTTKWKGLPRLAHDVDLAEEVRALEMLRDITKDFWWTRAWTFQENYRAGNGTKRMTLLIPHPKELEGTKREYQRDFGNIAGELQVSSVLFSMQATRLCLAVRHDMETGSPLETESHSALYGEGRVAEMIDHVLQTAGRYTILLNPSDPMTPTIISDIEKRGVQDVWDRLAITANCCQYATRLSTRLIRRLGPASPSLAMLTMCLLNGEILDNSTQHTASQMPQEGDVESRFMTVSQYLKARLFHGFRSPGGKPSLAFNKKCRFRDVTLTEEGMKTKGHLWEIGEVVDYADTSPDSDVEEDAKGETPVSTSQLSSNTHKSSGPVTTLTSSIAPLSRTTTSSSLGGGGIKRRNSSLTPEWPQIKTSLARLADIAHEKGHLGLAASLRSYIMKEQKRRDQKQATKKRKRGEEEEAKKDEQLNQPFRTSETFARRYLESMAMDLAYAMAEGKTLRLGRVCQSLLGKGWEEEEKEKTPYSAVFVWDDGGTPSTGNSQELEQVQCTSFTSNASARKGGNSSDGQNDKGKVRKDEPIYVFTSSWPGDVGVVDHDTNDIDRHVSMEVDISEQEEQNIHNKEDKDKREREKHVLHLRVKRWRLGMCFFEGCGRSEFVFPWPEDLLDISG